MTIKVYPSITPCEPVEEYKGEWNSISELFEWLSDDYRDDEKQPFSCTINGNLIPAIKWRNTEINEKDIVDIRLLPMGGAGNLLSSAFPFWSGSVSVGRYATSKIINSVIEKPKQPKAGQSGSQISIADLTANVARPNEIIPEGIGRYLRYPDYLNQVRRYFKDTRTQCIDVLLCVGWGYYSPEISTLSIGNTPITSLTVDYDYFEPSDDVSGHQSHLNWYTSDEVGSTTGSSGLRLYRGSSLTSGVFGASVETSGFNLSGSTLPSDWAVGDFISYAPSQSITIASNVLTGDFSDFSVSDGIRLRSDTYPAIDGTYTIDTISSDQTEVTLLVGGSPASFSDGTNNVYVTRSDFEYRIESITISGGTSTIFELTLFIDGVEDTGWIGFPSAFETADVLLAARSDSDGWAGPYVVCPYGETVDAIEIDILAVNGLGSVNDDGDIVYLSRTVEMQYREVGAVTWISEEYPVSGATRDQLGWTFRKSGLTAARYEVRVRRVEEENTATNFLDRIEWLSLKSKLPTVTSYAGATVIAMTIEGTESLASLSENQVNLVVTRMLEPFDGSGLSATRRIADSVYYIAKSVGYTDAEIDLIELDRLNTVWESRGETFDYFFSETTVKDAIDTVLTAGYSALTVDFGVLKPVRDEPRTVYEQGYSPENMTSPLTRVFTTLQPDDFDGVQVEYKNPATWTTETVDCLLSGDTGFKLDKITLQGAYTSEQAWRIGMRRRRAQVYRRWTYEFNTELDSLNSSYLSYCPLVDNIPGYGKVALMREIYADRVVLSEPMEWESGADHVISYRDQSGNVVGPFAATQGNDDYTVMCVIPTPQPENLPDREQVHFYFGTTERWAFPALITEITPSGRYAVSVTATNYSDNIYTDDDNSPE